MEEKLTKIGTLNIRVDETGTYIWVDSQGEDPTRIASILRHLGIEPNMTLIKPAISNPGYESRIGPPVSRDGEVKLLYNQDHTILKGFYIPAIGEGKDLTPEDVIQLLIERENVDPQFIITENIEAMLADPMTPYIIAQGIPPQHGRDATLSITVLEEKEVNPRDKIVWQEFKKAFITVREGTVIGRKIPATPGKDGIDVHGNIVPAKPGKDFNLEALAGKGTKVIKGAIISTTSGVLILAGKIRVEEILVIDGDVNFKVGNIHGVKHLWVKGDVKHGFLVRAQGKILIEGSVENATVEAGEAVFIRGIVTGEKGGHIHSDGFVYCREAHLAQITARGSVHIEMSAFGTKIKALDNVIVVHPRGKVWGGEIKALGHVYIPQIAATKSGGAKVFAGDPTEILKILPEAERRLVALKNRLEYLEMVKSRIRNHETIQKIESEIQATKRQLPIVRNAIKVLRGKLEEARSKMIFISISASQGTVFAAGGGKPYEVQNSPIGKAVMKNEGGRTTISPWRDPPFDINPPIIKTMEIPSRRRD